MSPLLPAGSLLKWGNFPLSCGRITRGICCQLCFPAPRPPLGAPCWLRGSRGTAQLSPCTPLHPCQPTLSVGHGSFPQSSCPEPARPLPPGALPHLWAQRGRLRCGGSMVAGVMPRRPCRAQGAQPAAMAAPSLRLPLPVPPPGQPSGPQPCPHPPGLPLSRLCPPLGAAPQRSVPLAPSQRGSCSHGTAGGSQGAPLHPHTPEDPACTQPYVPQVMGGVTTSPTAPHWSAGKAVQSLAKWG